MWAAVAGGAFWGGANVWVSYDGSTYEQVGVISGRRALRRSDRQLRLGRRPRHHPHAERRPLAVQRRADQRRTGRRGRLRHALPDQRHRARADRLRDRDAHRAESLRPHRLHPPRRGEHADRRPQRRRAVHPARPVGLRLPLPGDPGRQVDLREVPELQPLGRRADAALQLHRLLGDPGPAGRARRRRPAPGPPRRPRSPTPASRRRSSSSPATATTPRPRRSSSSTARPEPPPGSSAGTTSNAATGSPSRRCSPARPTTSRSPTS